MKFLGVFWGLRLGRTEQETRMIASAHVACRDYKRVGVLIASFRSSIAQPTYPPVYASLCTSRYPTQNSGPSGSLLLSREALSSSTPCRFIPAHHHIFFPPRLEVVVEEQQSDGFPSHARNQFPLHRFLYHQPVARRGSVPASGVVRCGEFPERSSLARIMKSRAPPEQPRLKPFLPFGSITIC